MASKKLNYIFDGQNVFQFATIIFLKSYNKWNTYIDPNLREKVDLAFDKRTLLTVTAIMLVANFIISLRSAFLPFAR